MSKAVAILDLMTDPDLFGNQFGGETWAAWRALLAYYFGLALNQEERRTVEAITRRADSPEAAFSELCLVVGRRGGKSQIAALLAVYLSAFQDYSERLAPGEVATIRVMAADRAQARVIMRYVSGLLDSNAMLKRLVIREDRESIELNNRCVIEVGTASFRTARGYSFSVVICDEIAFWRSDESANPDVEILNAVRPGLATLDGKLIILSSPYSKRGVLWDTYRRYFGKPGSVLVAQADTLTMNPSLPQRMVDEAMQRDPEAARAEYGAQFRSDLEQFLLREVVDAAVRSSPLELPYDNAHRYFAFVDPAGGGHDEFCLAIGHKEGDTNVIDVLRARRGIPAELTQSYAQLLKSYKVRKVTGDKYAGSWPADEFEKHGIKYTPSDKPKSGLYLDLLPALNSGRVELPPDDRLVNQLTGLERRTARGGRDSIDHPPGGHDDRANVIAGLVSTKAAATYDINLFVNGRPSEVPEHIQRRKEQTERFCAHIRACGIPLN